MINLNNYRKNIFHKDGYNECPHYSEDGVILKIFESIKKNKVPTVVEFGEHRILGTTTRSFRIKYFAKAIYFSGNLGLYSKFFNIVDTLKIFWKYKNIKFLKFLFNQPFNFFVTPDNIIKLLDTKKINNMDICCIDVDSYDYYLAEKLLESSKDINLFIVEYNPNLPVDKSITMPYPPKKTNSLNKRVYGASYLALKKLFTKHNYKLIHISGYCNLFYLKNELASEFATPNINEEIPKNDDEVNSFTEKFGMPGFYPSWLGQEYLSAKDYDDFEEPKV